MLFFWKVSNTKDNPLKWKQRTQDFRFRFLCFNLFFCLAKALHSIARVLFQYLHLSATLESILKYKLSLKKGHSFLDGLFLRITTLLLWLKSTLLLKIKCFDTTIYMKTQCLQTNEMQHYSRNVRCLRSGVGKRKGSVN